MLLEHGHWVVGEEGVDLLAERVLETGWETWLLSMLAVLAALGSGSRGRL